MSEDNGKQDIVPDLKDNSELFRKKEDILEKKEEPAPPSPEEKPDPNIRQMVITFNIKQRGVVVSGFIKDPMICLYMLNAAEDELKGFWARMIHDAIEVDRKQAQAIHKNFISKMKNRVKGAFGK